MPNRLEKREVFHLFFYSLLTLKPSLPHKKCHVCATRRLFTNLGIVAGI